MAYTEIDVEGLLGVHESEGGAARSGVYISKAENLWRPGVVGKSYSNSDRALSLPIVLSPDRDGQRLCASGR